MSRRKEIVDESESFDDVYAKKETEKALLCIIDEHEHWIPKSQLMPGNEVNEEGDKGTLVITAWLANEKGLG